MKNIENKQSRTPLLSGLFVKIGKKLGIKVFIENEWKFAGQLSYPNGIKRYFRASTVDINTVGAADTAKDKDYAKFFMHSMGYPVIPGGKFYSDRWAKAIGSNETIDHAWEFAKKMGMPVFLKPNSKSQGTGVTKVHTKAEFMKTFKSISKVDNVILVEQAIVGKDYRVVVLDNEIISAYERIPLAIVGDGKHTILQLLERMQRDFLKAGRDKTFLADDARLQMTLKRKKLTFDSIIPKGQPLQLLFNANLSTGGTSIDVTSQVHPFYKKQAIKLTKDMGLRLCGVDLMIEGDITTPANHWYIIEINAAPGLDHYASMGKKQQQIVEKLYTKVLIAMGKK
jgi:D-alanine-D-alanine ligase-like ATP-grasp enzyme